MNRSTVSKLANMASPQNILTISPKAVACVSSEAAIADDCKELSMAQKFKEVAHLRTDMEKYGEGYDRIFNKGVQASNGPANHPSDEPASKEAEDRQRIKELARRVYSDLESGQDTEGFPESSSFIYGFVKGYQASEGRERS